MSRIKDGGSAFPMQDPQAIHAYAAAAIESIEDPDERDRTYMAARGAAVGGMSLRDYFAAHAMQGLLAQSCGTAMGSDVIHGAQYAYAMADAMLAARQLGLEP